MTTGNNKPKVKTAPLPKPDEDIDFGPASNGNGHGEGVPAKAPKILSNIDFGALMDSVASENLDVLYLQARTKVRFLPLLEGRQPVLPVKTIYQGKTRTKYLMGVWNLSKKEGDELPTNRVQAVLLSKRSVRGVLQYAAEGWDLFSPELGRGVIFAKTGTGLQQEITMSPSPNPIPVPEDVMEEWYAFDMPTVAEEWEKGQAARAAENSNDKDTEEDADDGVERQEAPRQPAARKAQKARNESGW